MLADIKQVLTDSKRIVAHQKKLEQLRGEHFNIFSILKVESQENDTHSAFLGELLNPKGSHLMGPKFLSLFLNEIGDNSIELSSARLTLEYYVGSANMSTNTGGRIDIYIWDALGNSLSIENKIYAGDQEAQLKRYANHNKEKNTVFYLTLNGDDASEESKVDLKLDEDYYCLSYRTNIIDWLEACLKEATDQPILRESIKQYIILLKKLTDQLSNKDMENEIKEILRKNYTTAKHIEAGIKDVEVEAVNDFLNELKAKLKENLDHAWTISIDEDISISWKGLDIVHNTWGEGIRIKLEGQSKMPGHDSVYGIKAHDKKWDRVDVKARLAHIDFLQSGYLNPDTGPILRLHYNLVKLRKEKNYSCQSKE
ncbi:PD-(D/E)XK nuclease family protein [Aureitalea sp. L0-47]|uniref:PD-(D/E)XK nuclease family protein n=1 Tax=Aureitalea sp. L0-47 TaxID=2816962 RepID=UPI00223800B7|nr:PD-(D/E)XK nuclease family protein [Aureitalea sp. L0-47]MCW5521111.1 PD-(D/E)XK nuclease family protein [Aureitalea sp. L0-47]